MTGLLGKIIPGPVGWGLQLLGAGKSLAGKAFAWVTKSTVHILIVALVAVAVWGWLGHRSAAKWHRVADSTEIARKADRREYHAAQKEAEAAQIAANLATEDHYGAIAEEADNAYQTALNDARGLAGAYASRMRVTAACRPARVAGAAAEDGAPEDRDGTSGGPDMVAVSREDFTTLTDNTIRLQAVHDWGQSLVKDGLALPEVGF